jgi:hypothetical protein
LVFAIGYQGLLLAQSHDPLWESTGFPCSLLQDEIHLTLLGEEDAEQLRIEVWDILSEDTEPVVDDPLDPNTIIEELGGEPGCHWTATTDDSVISPGRELSPNVIYKFIVLDNETPIVDFLWS